MSSRPALRFLLDAMVAREVHTFLVSQGHEVYDVRDYVLPGTKDRTIVAVANELGAIIVTWNRKHYRQLVHRDDQYSREEFPYAGLLALTVPPSEAISHLASWMPYIEVAYGLRQHEDDSRFIAELTVNGLQLR